MLLALTSGDGALSRARRVAAPGLPTASSADFALALEKSDAGPPANSTSPGSSDGQEKGKSGKRKSGKDKTPKPPADPAAEEADGGENANGNANGAG
eukprot:12117358-Alexandrium_andersonii.AAC.1